MTAAPLDLLATATAALRRGDVRQAADDGNAAAQIFWRQGDADGHMRALNLLGAVAFEEGDLNDATARFERALSLAHAVGDTLVEARANNNLASVAHLRGNAVEALSLYRAALLSYQRIGDRRGAGETCHNLGLVFRELGELKDADEATEQAMRHAEAANDPQLLGLAVMGRAELELARGNVPVAARAVQRAEELMRQADDAVGALEVGRLRALVLIAQGNVALAGMVAVEGAKKARDLGSLLLVGELWGVAALAARRQGLAGPAEGYRKEALDAYNQLGASGHIEKLKREWDAIN